MAPLLDHLWQSTVFALAARRNESGALAMFRMQGVFQSLTFKGVVADGADVYETTFQPL